MSELEPLNKSYWMSQICESNFLRLISLIPDLNAVSERFVASVRGTPTLYIRVLERSPYTITMQLTHRFAPDSDLILEPNVCVRLYLDARSAEVLSDHARPFVMQALKANPDPRSILDYKWSLNYFLAQWLDHFLANDYCFSGQAGEVRIAVDVTA